MSLPFEFNAWTAVGFLGQFVFGARFIVQWISSERKGECHVPVIFWYLSLVGGLILTVYAVGQKEIVFTMGQGLGVFIYIRNLMLIKKSNGSKQMAMESDNAPADVSHH
jgi:lipid-A-disaccharide synthase-like uncharacterized protein